MTVVTEKTKLKLVRAPRAGILEVKLDGNTSDVLTILVNGKLQIKHNSKSKLSRETGITKIKYHSIEEIQEYVHKLAKVIYVAPLDDAMGQGPIVMLTYTPPNGLKTEYPSKQ